MLKSEYAANLALQAVESTAEKVARIAAMDKPFAFRLAAINASDCNKGKVWS